MGRLQKSKEQQKGKEPQKGKDSQKPGSAGSNKPFPLGNASGSSMGSVASLTPKPKTFLLLALTVGHLYDLAFRANDFMIGDFAGLKYQLDAMGIRDKKYFWSTVDLSKYCMTSKYSDIKNRSRDGEKVVYSNLKAEHRQNDYILKDQKTIKAELLKWMSDTAKEAQEGDCVNMIIICHGHVESGALGCGNSADPDQNFIGKVYLTVPEVLKALSWFKKGVQVNFITNACGSGALCKQLSPKDQQNRLIIAAASPGQASSGNGLVGWCKGPSTSGRYRSSFFTEVIIRSLCRINVDRISDLATNLQEDVYNKPWSTNKDILWAKSIPAMAGSSTGTEEAKQTLQQVLHLDYIQFPPEPQKAGRALRRESNTSIINNANPNNVDEQGHGSIVDNFFKEVHSESSNATCTGSSNYLWHLIDQYFDFKHGKTPNLPSKSKPDLFKCLYFRARIQSAFFGVFMLLHDLNIVSFVGLEGNMELVTSRHDEIRDVIRALGCFQLVHDLEVGKYDQYCTDPGYLEPVRWLAALIVRGSITNDLWFIFDRISMSGEFGGINIQYLRQTWKEHRLLNIDPKAGFDTAWGHHPGESPVIGFRLPYNINDIKDVHDMYKRYDNNFFMPLESLFFRYFKLPVYETLPKESLPFEFITNMIRNTDVMEL